MMPASEDHGVVGFNRRVLESAVESASDAIVITSRDALIEWVNPAFCRLTGYSLDEVVGQNPRLLKSGKQGPEFYEELWRTITSGQAWRGEVVNRRKDGSLYVEELSITPVRAGGGEITHFIGVKKDITDRVAAQSQLRRLNRLHSALNRMNEAVARIHDRDELLWQVCHVAVEEGSFRLAWFGELDEAGRVVPRAWSGASREYLEGLEITVEDQPLGRGPAGTAIREGRSVACQDTRSDPSFAPWKERAEAQGFGAVAAVPIRCGGSVIGAFTAYSADTGCFDSQEVALLERLGESISLAMDRAAADAKLRETLSALSKSEERLSQVIEGSNDGYWDWDLASGKVHASRRVEEMLGYAPGAIEPLARPWEELVHPDDLPAARDAWNAHLEGRSPRHEVELRMRTKSGEWKWVLQRGKVTARDPDGRSLRAAGTQTDIDARKRLEQALAESENRSRLAVEAARLAFWDLDVASGRIQRGGLGEELFGLKPGQFGGTYEAFLELVHPDDREIIERNVRSSMETGQPYVVEYRTVWPDGTVRWMSARGRWLPDANGRPARLIGVGYDITEQREAQARLEERNRFIGTVLDHLPVGVAVNSLAQSRYMNEKFVEVHGWPREQIQTAEDFYGRVFPDPEYREQILARIGSDIASGDPARMRWDDIQITTGSGERRTATVTAIPLSGPDVAIFVTEDITERRRLERAIEESEARYRMLVEHQGEGLGLVDVEERFAFANPAAEEIFGVPKGGLAGRCLCEFTPTGSTALVEEQTAMRQRGKRSTYEMEILRPDGERRALLVTATPRFDPLGGYDGAFGVFRDITDLKQAQLRLAHQAQVLSQMGEAVIGADLDYRITSWNCAAEELYGWRAEEAIGREIADVVPFASAPIPTAAIRERLATEGRWEGEAVIADRRGQAIPVWMNVSVLRNERQEEVGTVGVILDLRDRKRAEEMALRASRLESAGVLAGGVAHEFNNLMTVTLGNAELLKMRLQDRPEAAGALDDISSAARRGSQLAHQLLAFARVGRRDPRRLDVNAAIRAFLASRDCSHPPSIRIETDLEPALCLVVADPDQVRQVLSNLVANAVEAILEQPAACRSGTPAGMKIGDWRLEGVSSRLSGEGRIAVSTRNIVVGDAPSRPHGLAPGRYVCFSVENSGIGMDPATLARVFEPFFSTKFQGRGLGLAAAHGIVANHGGAIEVQSEPGAGTRFDVYLPVVEEPNPEPAVETGKKAAVLVVDADAAVLRLASDLVDSLGYRAIGSQNLDEAVRIASEPDQEIAAAIIDVSVARSREAGAVRALTQARPGLPVIVSSGLGLDPLVEALRAAGAGGFITKPFRLEDLRRALAAACREPGGT